MRPPAKMYHGSRRICSILRNKKLQVVQKQPNQLPSSVITFTSIFKVSRRAFPDSSATYHNETWMGEWAVLTTRNIQLAEISDRVGSMIPE